MISRHTRKILLRLHENQLCNSPFKDTGRTILTEAEYWIGNIRLQVKGGRVHLYFRRYKDRTTRAKKRKHGRQNV